MAVTRILGTDTKFTGTLADGTSVIFHVARNGGVRITTPPGHEVKVGKVGYKVVAFTSSPHVDAPISPADLAEQIQVTRFYINNSYPHLEVTAAERDAVIDKVTTLLRELVTSRPSVITFLAAGLTRDEIDAEVRRLSGYVAVRELPLREANANVASLESKRRQLGEDIETAMRRSEALVEERANITDELDQERDRRDAIKDSVAEYTEQLRQLRLCRDALAGSNA